MDEVGKRLQETSENCTKYYEAWSKDKKNPETRETLQEAIHELRKVASRLEIEVAVSERDEMTDRPLPIPSHRSNQRGNKGQGNGNNAGGGEGQGKPARKLPPRKNRQTKPKDE